MKTIEQIQNFKIRASAAHHLMIAPKSKSEVLSAGAKTYLEDWYSGELEKEINNNYIKKGNTVEDRLISFAAVQLDEGFAEKNTLFFENDYICGTPDVIFKDFVLDTKASWSLKTLHNAATEKLNKAYYWQGICYMSLTGLKKHLVFYGLLNTPADCNWGVEVEYEHIEASKRYVCYQFDFNETEYLQLVEKVIAAREYLLSHHNSLNESLGKLLRVA